MHCNACVVLIQDTLKEQEGVTSVKVDLSQAVVDVVGNFTGDAEQIAKFLTRAIQEHGYTLTTQPVKQPVRWNEFVYAAPISLLLVIGFLFLQRLGVVNLISSSQMQLTTALVIGLIASVSTCLAVVGGLVLSVSTNYAKAGNAWKPQLLFHVGRLVGFFVLGGMIGVIGKTVQFSTVAHVVLNVLIGVVMFILGINLLDVFRRTKGWQLTLPGGANRIMRASQRSTHVLVPGVLGILTFFLPCGFTQSMQLYALSTGSFLQGGLHMLVFALGTLPVLALLSFTSFNFAQKAYAGVFYKSAGLLVMILALFNIWNTLAVLGVLKPIVL